MSCVQISWQFCGFCLRCGCPFYEQCGSFGFLHSFLCFRLQFWQFNLIRVLFLISCKFSRPSLMNAGAACMKCIKYAYNTIRYRCFRDFWKFNRHIIWYYVLKRSLSRAHFIIFIQLLMDWVTIKAQIHHARFIFWWLFKIKSASAVNKFLYSQSPGGLFLPTVSGEVCSFAFRGKKWKSKRYPITIINIPSLDGRV